MKLLFTTSFTLSLFYYSVGQNTGIGITTPRAKLHVFAGASGNTNPFSPVVVESNSHTYINLLSPDAYETSILFGKASDAASGGIMYNSFNTPNGLQFRTNGNLTRMLIRNNGDVGIGIGENVPGATLHVHRGTNAGGTAIFNGTDYASHFNYSSTEDTYIRAGKDNGVVILNDIPGGKVGIGTTAPNAPLGFPPALGKKITLYPGVTGDVGFAVQGNLLQMYSDHPNADIAFGYDQAGAFTERFRMKANGTFVVNGNSGSAGQVLQTNGDGAVPTWSSPTNLLYNNTILLVNATQIALTSSNWVIVPELTYSFSNNSNTKVIVNFTLYAIPGSCIPCGPTSLYIDIVMDGSIRQRFHTDIANGSGQTFVGTAFFQVAAGSHTIHIEASRLGPNIYVGHYGTMTSQAVFQIIPQ